MTRETSTELPSRGFRDAAAWERWLHANHAKAPGIWVRFAKKGSGVASVTYPEAVEVALCYGWIDGQVRSLDEVHYLQRFTPRRSRSNWSKINTEKAERLVAEGRMRPAGLREVERAKADGRWAAAYDPQGSMQVPDDLRAALKRSRKAAAAFDKLSASNRYAILYQIHDAKRSETRARRIERFVAKLEAGQPIL